MTNAQISDALELLGLLMELHGENPFKARSYAGASYTIYKYPSPLSGMTPEELSAVPGIGVAIRDKIRSLLEQGHLPQLDELLQKTPAGLLEVMKVKGLGPKKVRTIWQELGVENLGELKYACLENRLTLLKGFGEKTQDNVLHQIEFMERNSGKFRYAEVEPEVLQVKALVASVFGQENVEEAGPFRRRLEVLEQADLLVRAAPEELLEALEGRIEWKEDATDPLQVILECGLPLYLHAAETGFGSRLFELNGSASFLLEFGKIFPYKNKLAETEKDLFEAAGLPFVEPEMRETESRGLEMAQAGTLPVLVQDDAMRGVVHAHSTWSDGMNSIEEMAGACREMGYQYLCMSDHSQSAFYANGLKADRILKQHKEIDQLNQRLQGFKIFKGIESDILFDGQLDYPDEVLASFDFVIASVHSILKMSREKATERVLAAIRNPYTTILGHPTGRLLLSREGYPLDMSAIIEACARHKVVLELNANPYRLDIDWRFIREALNKGVMIAVNPDAHNIAGIQDIRYGLLAARKGGLSAAQLFNHLTTAEMEEYFAGRKRARG